MLILIQQFFVPHLIIANEKLSHKIVLSTFHFQFQINPIDLNMIDLEII